MVHENMNERVISQQDVRLYRAQVYLLGSTSEMSFAGARIEYLNPLPVYDDTGKLIGGANVSCEPSGGKLRADLVFDYAIPERLDIETDQPVYAHPRGWLLLNSPVQPLSFYDAAQGPALVASVKLVGVTISIAKALFGSQIVGVPA